ncbi:MAG: PKD domain-containing protein, partial [Bacteroidia bacterium]
MPTTRGDTVAGAGNGMFKVDSKGNYVFGFHVESKIEVTGKALSYYNNSKRLQTLLAKFDTAANLIWYYNDSLNDKVFNAISLDEDDNIYTYTYYYRIGKYYFDKYNTNGQLVNSKFLSDVGRVFLNNSAIGKGKYLYAVGTATDKFTFAGKTFDENYDSPVLLKYDSNFNEVWMKYSSSPYKGEGFSISANNKTDNVFIFGVFNQQINFGLGVQGNMTDRQSFITGFNSSGLPFWSKTAVMINNQNQVLSFHEDKCGSLYVNAHSFAYKPNLDGKFFGSDDNNDPNYGTTTTLIKYKFDTAKYLRYNNNQEFCGQVHLQSDFDKSYKKLFWLHDGKIIDSNKKELKYSFANSGKYAITLLGIKESNCQYTFTDTITFFKQLKAKFTHKDTAGCQWVGYQFINQSVSDTIQSKKGESYLWNFGDGTIDTAKNPLHIFTKSGNFKVSLVYSNGFCLDTFTQEQTVEILAAPKPGFIVNDTIGCVPFTVNVKDNSQGEVVKYTYSFGKENESNDANPTYTFTKPGIYYITQKLLGATGCITADSVRIRIRAGILPDEKPEMLRATFINNNQVEISWRKHPLAKHYNLYKQYDKNDFVLIQKNFPDTIYMDQTVSPDNPFRYYIQATDSCDNLSAQSLITQPVILHGENKDNTIFLLTYTSYEKWQNGVKEYVLQYQPAADSFTAISNAASLFQTDSFRTQSPNGRQCYRILALEMDGNKQESYSNTVCLPHIPQVYVPNAFSPNNDAVNDIFGISAIGITESNINIYNRWGEKIYQNQPGKAINWDGNFKSAPAPDDVYIYTLQLRTIHGKKI